MTTFKINLKHLSIKVFCCFLLLPWTNKDINAQDLPRVIKPSPEASSLFRFQDYPMDYSTGLPEISIPVYEVKSGSLSVPISLSYHASGRKVYDQDGPIATGWSLNAGGMISRTIYGAVDFGTAANGTFKFPYPFNINNITNINNLPYLEQVMHFDKNPDDVGVGSWLDAEYDIFSYYANNMSGKFIFKDSNGVKTPVLIPYKPYVITPYYTQNGLTAIDLLDDKGVLYKFTGSETTLQTLSVIETVPATTGYTLSKIISADKSDTISFIYTSFAQTRTSISQSIVWNDDETNFGGQPNDVITEGPTNYENTTHDPYQVARLTEIDFRQGKVLFNLVSGMDKIGTIQIVNLNNAVLQTFQLSRSIMDNLSEIGYSTNKLDSLEVKDNNGLTLQKYSFDYFPTTNASPSFNVRYRDWWGYYNASGVHDLVPYYTNLQYIAFNQVNIQNNYTVGNPAYNREPNLSGLESGVLKKITYPTGGSTEFTYEKNAYYSYAAQQIKFGPGLRVAQIKTDDNNGTLAYKTYTYGDNESGYGVLDMEPDITNMATEIVENQISNGMTEATDYFRSRTFNSDFLPNVGALADRPVIYSTVTEYQGTLSDNTGKTVYNYDYSPWSPAGMPTFESTTIQKKHIYSYNYWNTPSLLKKIDYKNISVSGSPSYQMRRQITNTYNSINTQTISGLHVQRVHTLPQSDRVAGPPPLYAEPYAVRYYNPLMNIYTYNEYQIPTGIKNLASTSQTLYNDDNSTVSTNTSYTYNAYQYISKTTQNTSDGASIINQTNYPLDYTGNSLFTQMNSPVVNMLNFPVEEINYKNATLLKSKRINYYNWGGANPRILPQSIDVKKGSNTYETRIQFYGYDINGNPTSLSKSNDAAHSYIWDYKRSYPVAEVSNANLIDIAYTSFEADGTGNWIIASTSRDNTQASTGKIAYNLANGAISIANNTLDPAKKYILSYWSRNGKYTLTATDLGNKAGRTVNGWTYYEHTITVSSLGGFAISGSGLIDELRLYPVGAQMTTYTYTPLIGMTSKCDAAGTVSYFEYDALGRLKLLRDLNGNIIKTFDYQYQSITP